MGFIYMLISPYEKSYIGQTTRPIEERFKEHQFPSSKCVAIYNAIQKYGWENFEKHWYECPDEELNDHEELMIEVLGTLAPSGYNLREGGGAGGKLSEETKQKISQAHTGKILSEETRGRMSKAKSGEKHPMHGKNATDETKKKMSASKSGAKNHMYGKIMSEETIEKMSASKSGAKNPNSKKVYQYDTNDAFVQSFVTCGEAAQSLNKSGSAINMCASGKRKLAYGFRWSYTEL
ncbi:GIY-YIG catalytic domain-containing endonuclease [Acanthocystis turfacea Chlorella virus NE-JV-3]|nr:GIY-YIG catalytic domain-containing endonuclease [Acanthocystis turfacea Chlorella virus NE-JV-3]